MDDFEGFKTSVEEVTTNVVEISREQALEVEPEAVNELLQSHDLTVLFQEIAAAPPALLDQSAAINIKARPSPANRYGLLKAQVIEFFINKVFLNEVMYIVFLDIILLHT